MIYDMEEIKALIAGYVERHPLAEECGCLYALLDIIDKYKGESEG